ncbi:hypothetical protein ACW9KT_13075 [Hymenobacter sp. HD11105]|jgi:hypothetical protein
MPHIQNSDGSTQWIAPGGLPLIPQEELHRILDEENIQPESLEKKTASLAKKIQSTYEKTSGEKLQSGDIEAFQALVQRESANYLARRPHP